MKHRRKIRTECWKATHHRPHFPRTERKKASHNTPINQSINHQSVGWLNNQSNNQSTTLSSCECYLVPWRSVFPRPKYRPTRTLRAKKQASFTNRTTKTERFPPPTSLLSFRHSMWSKSILTYKLYCTPRSTSSPECSSAQEPLPPDPCPLLPWPPPWPCPWWSHILSNKKNNPRKFSSKNRPSEKKHKKVQWKNEIIFPWFPQYALQRSPKSKKSQGDNPDNENPRKRHGMNCWCCRIFHWEFPPSNKRRGWIWNITNRILNQAFCRSDIIWNITNRILNQAFCCRDIIWNRLEPGFSCWNFTQWFLALKNSSRISFSDPDLSMCRVDFSFPQ